MMVETMDNKLSKLDRRIVSLQAVPIPGIDERHRLFVVDDSGKAWTIIFAPDSFSSAAPMTEREWRKLEPLPLKLPPEHVISTQDKIRVGSKVMVYDYARFAFPLPGIVESFGDPIGASFGVAVKLIESNTTKHPVGSIVWVHEKQLRSL